MPNQFPLSPQEEQEVVAAIRQAENNTSGEIRVHSEAHCPTPKVAERAEQLFFELKMHNTKQENGVLIYLAYQDHVFYIMGDKGIDKVVEGSFWETTKDVMQQHFKNNRIGQGLTEGILKAGKQLRQHFPWQTDDINELPDEISKA